ncbi:MAG: tetratricopeptide repeat protein [Treponema sp.]|jgi:tetratricopeptide (TPR) repeat protein|nr:tetratricopeptide repeat protein [Treponema sp.]
MMKVPGKIPAAVLVLLTVPVFFNSCRTDRADEKTLLLYSRSAAAYAQGRFQEASDLLKEVEGFSPALTLRAKALYFDNRPGEAEPLLRRVLRRNPGSGEAALFLARILREQEKEGEARILIEDVLRNNPQEIRALRLASDLAARRGDAEDAAALLDRAVEASAETALVYIDRAKLRWIAGNGGGALEDLRRAEILLPWNASLGRGIGDLRRIIGASEGRISSPAEQAGGRNQ